MMFLAEALFCGFTKGVEVVSIEEATSKYRAACAKRDRLDPDVVVIARTDSRAAAWTRSFVDARPIWTRASTCSWSWRFKAETRCVEL